MCEKIGCFVMLNVLRADVYRLVRTKGFWILQVVIAGMVISHITLSQKVTIDGVAAIQSSTDGVIMYYILPLIMIVLGADFSNGTLKEMVTSGISCTKFFFSKLVSYGVLQLLLIVETYLLPFLFGLVLGGPGHVTGKFAATVLYQGTVFWVLLFAITVFTYFLLYLTKSSAVCMTAAVLVPLIIYTCHFMNSGLRFLNYVDFMLCMANVQATSFAHLGAVSYGLIGAGVIIVAGSLGNSYYFNHMNL